MSVSVILGLLLALSILTLSSFLIEAKRFPKPDISIGFNADHDTTTGGSGGIIPRVRWTADTTSIGGLFDVQGGIDLTITDVRQPPEAFMWGEVKRFCNRNISIRGNVDANDRNLIDLDVRLNEFNNFDLRVLGSIDFKSKSMTADQIMTSINFKTPIIGGQLNIDPRYDLRSKRADAAVGYTFRDTSLMVDGNNRKLTLSQMIGRSNAIIPSLKFGMQDDTTDKKRIDFNLKCRRDLQDGGQVSTTWKPDDYVSIQWIDGGWNARISAPIDGYYNIKGGVKLSVKQNVDVSLL